MKITITKEQLSNGLQAVQNVVATRTTLPVLSNVLLRAQGDRLELTATDLDISVTTSVPATVKKAGATTVPAKKFFGIIRELGPQDIDLDTGEIGLNAMVFAHDVRRLLIDCGLLFPRGDVPGVAVVFPAFS